MPDSSKKNPSLIEVFFVVLFATVIGIAGWWNHSISKQGVEQREARISALESRAAAIADKIDEKLTVTPADVYELASSIKEDVRDDRWKRTQMEQYVLRLAEWARQNGLSEPPLIEEFEQNK